MRISKFIVTFGPVHDEIHEGLGLGRLSKGWVEIQAPDHARARHITYAIFGDEWAFDYTPENFFDRSGLRPLNEAYPEGVRLVIPWLDRREMDEIAVVIDETYAAADGDSNDGEIELLQAARDELAMLVHYQPKED